MSRAPTAALVLRNERTDWDEVDQRPLDFGLITRLFRYTEPHAAQRLLRERVA